MRIKLTLFIISLVMFLVPVALAQDVEQKPQEVNSFELFWPVVAGKVKGDSFYSLKLFKEKMRGMLIFGKPQKADYSLFLATKRILEAEKLSQEGKKDYAKQTFAMAVSQLDIVESNVNSSGDGIKVTVDELNNKFSNLETFLPYLITQYSDEELRGDASKILDKVTEIHSKI